MLKGNLPFALRNRRQIGVIGGGQLARMLVDAAKARFVDVIVQTPSKEDPGAESASRVVLAESNDVDATKKFGINCSGITFENEWLNIDDLKTLEREGLVFCPQSSSIAPLLNKLSQRKLLYDLGIPGPKWIPFSSLSKLKTKLPQDWTFPVMAKTNKGGYDGKGTKVINSLVELENFFQLVDKDQWFLESWIDYDIELALVSTRDRQGNVRTLPLAETHQSYQVCDWVLAPANVNHDVETTALNIASSLLSKLNYVGVLAIEFFYGRNGLQVNELAPRTHNSAHFSIEACSSSQFDQQVCIAADLLVPQPELIVPGALMVNLLGLPEGTAGSIAQRLSALQSIDSVNLHWYGKKVESLGRKLGHVTVLLNATNPMKRKEEAIQAMKKIRSIWPSLQMDSIDC